MIALLSLTSYAVARQTESVFPKVQAPIGPLWPEIVGFWNPLRSVVPGREVFTFSAKASSSSLQIHAQ
jgi:hypothetical protein